MVRPWMMAVAGLLTAGAVFAQTGVAGPAQVPPQNDVREVRGLWRIDQARIEPIYDRKLARLDFGPDGRLSGHTSCNTLSAEYSLDGAQLRIGSVSITRQRCSRLQLEQEDRILTALELAVSARVRDDGLLELRDAEGRGVLRGTRFSVDAPGALPDGKY